jgi:hypothetical protein
MSNLFSLIEQTSSNLKLRSDRSSLDMELEPSQELLV